MKIRKDICICVIVETDDVEETLAQACDMFSQELLGYEGVQEAWVDEIYTMTIAEPDNRVYADTTKMQDMSLSEYVQPETGNISLASYYPEYIGSMPSTEPLYINDVMIHEGNG